MAAEAETDLRAAQHLRTGLILGATRRTEFPAGFSVGKVRILGYGAVIPILRFACRLESGTICWVAGR